MAGKARRTDAWCRRSARGDSLGARVGGASGSGDGKTFEPVAAFAAEELAAPGRTHTGAEALFAYPLDSAQFTRVMHVLLPRLCVASDVFGSVEPRMIADEAAVAKSRCCSRVVFRRRRGAGSLLGVWCATRWREREARLFVAVIVGDRVKVLSEIQQGHGGQAVEARSGLNAAQRRAARRSSNAGKRRRRRIGWEKSFGGEDKIP